MTIIFSPILLRVPRSYSLPVIFEAINAFQERSNSVCFGCKLICTGVGFFAALCEVEAFLCCKRIVDDESESVIILAVYVQGVLDCNALVEMIGGDTSCPSLFAVFDFTNLEEA